MSFNRITDRWKFFYRTIFLRWRTDIYYLTDSGIWSFYWDAYYITQGLRNRFGLRTHIIHDCIGFRNQIIHFGDRYAYLKGNFRIIHPSNQVFLTWFHGDLGDPNPDMQRLIAVIPEAAEYLKKIVVSCEISKRVLAGLGIPENKLVKIPLGVDLDRFIPQYAEARSELRAQLGIPKNVFCMGSFQKDGQGWEEGYEPKMVKGPDIFLEVVEKLYHRYRNIFILLTGPARGYVKKGLEKIGVPYLHKYLPTYYDIVPYYQVLDLYIITSRSEGGPKALLESWATGVPVVSTRVGMPADLIQHGKNGMIAEVEDVQGLTDHAITLIENKPLRERCIKQGLKDVKKYDWSLIADRYYKELYLPILERG